VALFIPPYDSPEDAGQCWIDAGVEVTNAPLPGAAAAGPLRYFALARHLLAAVAAWRPAVVHVFKPKGPSGLVGSALWARRPRAAAACALVVDADDWEGPGGWNDDPRTGYSALQKLFFAWQERSGLSRADAWTVTSECLRQRALAFGAAPERLFVLHNGVAGVMVGRPGPASLDHRPPAVDAPCAILYTRFAGVRPEDVIAIWTRVRAMLPDARLVVAGRGVGGEERRLAGEPGIDPVGWVESERLSALFARAQVAVAPWADTPSNRARHSAKVLELMAAGLPLVAYAVGELPVTSGEAGVCVPPGDAAACARAVVELLTDADRARRLGAAAQRRVAEQFAWSRLVDVALAAYEAARGAEKE
jgi:glycosyltransferase involved in cell wall biosynthesis